LDDATDSTEKRVAALIMIAFKAILWGLLIFYLGRCIAWFFSPTLERL